MCGIAGFIEIDNRPASVVVLTRMTDAISHRGPDGDGHWADGPVALGHRRLAIIDLSDGGRQPMQTEDGRYTLTFNGEIYNYRELRAALQARGEQFHTSSDTEVLLKGLRVWGMDCLAKINGMFAFALWDSQERRLTLARDRFGVKPMYWAQVGQTLMFGSEVKAFMAHPAFKAELAPTALREYLTFQNFYGDRTLFKGVHLLPPGSAMSIEVGKGRSEPRQYWSFAFHGQQKGLTEPEAAIELSRLFHQAVGRQLVSDVDVGAYLSGGLDSGSITAVASSLQPYIRTFTCGFDLSSASGMEVYFDERRDAEMMSARFRTEQYEMVLKAGDMERAMPALARHLEEPRVGQSYPNFLIARLASRFNKVVLAGTGGDELFGGYPWRYAQTIDSDPAVLKQKLFGYWQRILPDARAAEMFAPIWSDVRDVSPQDLLAAELPDMPARMTVDEALQTVWTFEARTFLQGLLAMEDKTSMAHSLEVRVPFLDNDLVDFAQSLPAHFKVAGFDSFESVANLGASRTSEGKKVYRAAMRPLMPAEIVDREKQGFSAPDASWFKGESLDYVRRLIGTPKAKIYDCLDYAAIRPMLDDHFEGRVNHRLMVWSLLNLEEAFGAFGL